MIVIVLLMAAVTAWFYAAAAYQNRGYSWADQTCASMPTFCDEPYKVAVVAVAVVTLAFIIRVIRA